MNKTTYLSIFIVLIYSCKKELGGDFYHIFGKWKWVKTTHSWIGTFDHQPHIETVNTSDINEDDYFVEFVKNGLVITYTNKKVNKKYRVKYSNATYENVFNRWGYTIELPHKKVIDVDYSISNDTIRIGGFFPRTLGDYGRSEDDIGHEWIDNYFVRE